MLKEKPLDLICIANKMSVIAKKLLLKKITQTHFVSVYKYNYVHGIRGSQLTAHTERMREKERGRLKQFLFESYFESFLFCLIKCIYIE